MANPYMPFYTGDYLRKTRRLKAAEHGAYMLLLIALWDEGGVLPNDDEELREIARCSRRTWPKIWAKIAPFFVITEGQISQQKVTDTLAETSKKRQSYVERGRRGGSKSSRKANKNSAGEEAQLKQGLSNQTKGLVSPLRDITITLPQDGALALEGLRAACVSEHTRTEVAKLTSCITGWRDGVFLVTGRYAAERFAQQLAPELRAVNVKLEVGATQSPEQPKFIAIEGGKSCV